MADFSSTIKNIFLLLLLLQFAPPLIKNIQKSYGSFFEQKTLVGVVSFKGMITSSEKYLKTLKKYFKDPEIKAIVLEMDCPGGAAGSSQALFQEIKALKATHLKPVIVRVENICASGGYYIASACDHIIATPSAFIGSIGAYIPLVKVKELLDQVKVSYNPVSSGSYKLAADPFTEGTPAQRAMLQDLTNDTYNQFIRDIAQSRTKLALAQAHEWADGKIFTGHQAFEKGLIDEIGAQSALENYLKQKITVTGDIKYIKQPKQSPLSQLFGSGDSTEESSYAKAANALIATLAGNFFIPHV